MKKACLFLCSLLVLAVFAGCAAPEAPADIAATTLPVYEFTSALCSGTGLTVTRLVTEEVSCLHDYSLNVRQVKAAEAAKTLVISGAGLEEFLHDLIHGRDVIDASQGIALLCPSDAQEEHEGHDHSHEGHHHEEDPHIWLSPAIAAQMAENICSGLETRYPQHADTFRGNLAALQQQLQSLKDFGRASLSDLSCRELITFHDGFSYLAQAFDLTILRAVEEESGSEASAQELKELITLVTDHSLTAIFTETNGADSAATVIARSTGASVFTLDMAMSGDSYFDAMYHNIRTLKEALQ